MKWKTFRLDLARCEEFPEGSSHRHYLIDLPIDQKGALDAAAALAAPGRAIVRRYWPNAPDVVGVARPDRGVWSIEFRKDDLPRGILAFTNEPIATGTRVQISEPDARIRDYVVAGISAAS